MVHQMQTHKKSTVPVKFIFKNNRNREYLEQK